MSQIHEFHVEMTCEGCSGAVQRVLGKIKDQVESVNINLDAKKVAVQSTMSADQLLEVIKKTGKETTYIGSKPV